MSRLMIMAAKEDYANGAPHMANMRKWEAYAAKSKVAFAYEQVKSVPNGRELPWSKVLLFAKYYQTYDEILWVDTALELKDESVNLFDKFAEVQNDILVKAVFVFMRTNFEYDTRVMYVDCREKAIVKEYLDSYWGDAKSPEISDSIVINHMWPRLYGKKRRITGKYISDCIGPLTKQAPKLVTAPAPAPKPAPAPAPKPAPAPVPAPAPAPVPAPAPAPALKRVAMVIKYQPQYGVHDDISWLHLREAIQTLGYTVTLYAKNIIAPSKIRSPALTVEPHNALPKGDILYEHNNPQKGDRILTVSPHMHLWYPLYEIPVYTPRTTTDYVLVTFATDFVSLILLEHLNSDNLKKVHCFSAKPFNADTANKASILSKVKQHNTITIKDLVHFFANANYMPQNVYFIGDDAHHHWYYDVCAAGFPLIHYCPEVRHIGNYYSNMLEVTESSFLSKPYKHTVNKAHLEELNKCLNAVC